jgi:hypothetical protein
VENRCFCRGHRQTGIRQTAQQASWRQLVDAGGERTTCTELIQSAGQHCPDRVAHACTEVRGFLKDCGEQSRP